MCILLCFIEYNEKSRLGTTYPDELFKNAVAAVYKAAAAATQPLFLFFFCLFVYTTFYYYYYVYICDVRENISLSCREHVWCGEENCFFSAQGSRYSNTYIACTVVHYSDHVYYTHTYVYVYCLCVCVTVAQKIQWLENYDLLANYFRVLSSTKQVFFFYYSR